MNVRVTRIIKGRHSRARMVVGLTTTYVVESRSRRGVKYVIKFVRDLLQVDGLLRVLRFPSPIKLTATV